MNLEIKHLIPYLPYKIYTGMPRCGKIEKYLIYGIKINQPKWEDVVFIDDKAHGNYQSSYLKGIKPILRPMSDLTKFELRYEGFDTHIDYLTHEKENPMNAPYEMIEYLFSKHFDVFGLIEKGLAIDASTLISTTEA